MCDPSRKFLNLVGNIENLFVLNLVIMAMLGKEGNVGIWHEIVLILYDDI